MLKLFRTKVPVAYLIVRIDGQDQKVECKPGASVLDSLLEAGIEISHSCGGMGTCGTCRVDCADADLPTRNSIEQETAEQRDFKPSERLACQTTVRSGMLVSPASILSKSDSDQKID